MVWLAAVNGGAYEVRTFAFAGMRMAVCEKPPAPTPLAAPAPAAMMEHELAAAARITGL